MLEAGSLIADVGCQAAAANEDRIQQAIDEALKAIMERMERLEDDLSKLRRELKHPPGQLWKNR